MPAQRGPLALCGFGLSRERRHRFRTRTKRPPACPLEPPPPRSLFTTARVPGGADVSTLEGGYRSYRRWCKVQRPMENPYCSCKLITRYITAYSCNALWRPPTAAIS